MKLFVCLILGLTYAISHAQTKFVVARYQADGTLDPSFSGGKVGTAFEDPNTQADIAAELKGVALIGQTANAIAVGNAGRFAALASYTSSGALNPAFNGGAGTRLLHLMKPQLFSSISSNANSAANAVALKNGKIVVAGYFEGELCNNLSEGCAWLSRQFAVARFNADGTLDQTFDGDGRIRISFQTEGCTWSEANAVAIDSANRVIVGGTAGCGGTTHFAVARYHWDGTPDNTLDQNGKVTRSLPPEQYSYYLRQTIQDLTIDGNGQILATGAAESDTPFNSSTYIKSFVVLRFLADGSLDTIPSSDGVLPVFWRSSSGGGYSSEGFSVATMPNGRIVVGGQHTMPVGGSSERSAFAVARLLWSGAPDTTFSGNGRQETIFQSGTQYLHSGIRDIALVGDKILAVGWSGGKVALARYNSDGSPDATFGVQGRRRTHFTCSGAQVAEAVALPDIRGATWFLVGGTAQGTIWPGDICITTQN